MLAAPDNDGAGSVAGGQQALVAVEGDGQHSPTVALQRVDSGPCCPSHVEEVDTGIFTARHCGDRDCWGMGGTDIRPTTPFVCKVLWDGSPFP